MQDATQKEITEYGKLPDKAVEAEQAITANKRREVQKRLELAREETEKSIVGAKGKYRLDEDVVNASAEKSRLPEYRALAKRDTATQRIGTSLPERAERDCSQW